jgi:hypothetical protein
MASKEFKVGDIIRLKGCAQVSIPLSYEGKEAEILSYHPGKIESYWLVKVEPTDALDVGSQWCVGEENMSLTGRAPFVVTDKLDADAEHQRAINQGWSFPTGSSCKRCGNWIRVPDADQLYEVTGGKLVAMCDSCWVAVDDNWNPERTGPTSGGSDLAHEQVVAALTAKLPANVEARKRMVAALAKELARPVTPRYPHEGRSDRVFKVNR